MSLTVECPGCHVKSQVPDTAAGKRGKCRQCGHLIVVPVGTSHLSGDGDFDPPPAAPPPLDQQLSSGGTSMSSSWFVMENGQKVGPLGGNIVEQMIVAGRVRSDTLVWKEGLAQWMPANALTDLPGRMALAAAAPPMPPTTMMPMGYAAPAVAGAEAAWSGSAMAGLVIATVLVPLVGLIMGPMNLGKPARKGQAIALLIVGIVMALIYIGSAV